MFDRDLAGTETLRLSEIHTLDVFYTPLEARFDRICRLAKRALKVPVAAIALMAEKSIWYKSVDGWNVFELPIEKSLCAHTIIENNLIVVEDLRLNDQFSNHPLTVHAPRFRFYAGMPLRQPDGAPIGALSLYDTKPRRMSPGQLQSLQDLAEIAQKEILTTELRDAHASVLNKLGLARRQAAIDELTRVWSRRAGTALLEAALMNARRVKKQIAACMVDVDSFKEINDRLGHQCGDQVLRKVASTMVDTLRPDDSVCRYGGDEFLLVLDDITADQLNKLLERLRHTFESRPIRTRAKTISVTLSIGAAIGGTETESAEQLMQLADRALYQCKSRGRNRFAVIEAGKAGTADLVLGDDHLLEHRA